MIRNYLITMLELVREGGEIALALIGNSSPELKADDSVITQADLQISALAHRKLAPVLSQGGHVLVDEEDPRRGDYLNDSFLETHPFVWALDPVDATRAYANKMPHYGISIGLIRDRRPWLGAVYFPSLRELFFCDGTDAWFVTQAFTPSEIRTRIIPRDEPVSDRSVFIASDEILTHFGWTPLSCRVMVFAAAVCEYCWPAIGRGCGSLSRVYLWDMAGSWPIFERAGLQLRSLRDGKILDRLETSLFLGDDTPWKLKDYFILSSEKNFPVFKKSLSWRGDGHDF